MSLLNDVVADIGRGIYSSPLPQPTPTELGEYGDFDVTPNGPVSTFKPISDAAIRWVVEHIPEWVNRHGTRSFILDTNEMNQVVAAAERDELISVDTYRQAEKQTQEWWHQQNQEGWTA